MSEAEFISTFHGYLGEIHTLMFGYISLMSGFLVASYLVARKLTKTLAVIVVLLFSVVSTVLVFKIMLMRMDFQSLVAHVRELQTQGVIELSWWGLSPSWAPELVTSLELVSLVGGFVGCLLFFLFQRKSMPATD